MKIFPDSENLVFTPLIYIDSIIPENTYFGYDYVFNAVYNNSQIAVYDKNNIFFGVLNENTDGVNLVTPGDRNIEQQSVLYCTPTELYSSRLNDGTVQWKIVALQDHFINSFGILHDVLTDKYYLALKESLLTNPSVFEYVAYVNLESNISFDKIYIAMLFVGTTYDRGINDIIELINLQFPDNNLVISKYIVDGTVVKTEEALNDFITKYPGGRRITISQRTSILSQISAFFVRNGLDIPSLSATSSAKAIQDLPNVLTFAPFDQYSAMSVFMICNEYQTKNIKILYEVGTPNDLFILGYIDYIRYQAQYLNINVTQETLAAVKDYQIEDNTNIIILSDYNVLKNVYLTPSFFEQVRAKKSCYITLTDLDSGCEDIFEDIPAFVLLPTPLNYTSTSEEIYQFVKNKINPVYFVYQIYDMLYKLVDMGYEKVELTISSFIENNAFQVNNKLEAYLNALVFNESINGTNFGKYDAVFTKDSIIGDNLNLYLQYNSGGLQTLPQSRSSFKLVGIVPFFASQIYYNENEYFELYNVAKPIPELYRVGYDFTNCSVDSGKVNTGTLNYCKFIYKFANDGFLQSLTKMFDNLDLTSPEVNLTMSKKISKLYFIPSV